VTATLFDEAALDLLEWGAAGEGAMQFSRLLNRGLSRALARCLTPAADRFVRWSLAEMSLHGWHALSQRRQADMLGLTVRSVRSLQADCVAGGWLHITVGTGRRRSVTIPGPLVMAMQPDGLADDIEDRWSNVGVQSSRSDAVAHRSLPQRQPWTAAPPVPVEPEPAMALAFADAPFNT